MPPKQRKKKSVKAVDLNKEVMKMMVHGGWEAWSLDFDGSDNKTDHLTVLFRRPLTLND